MYYIYISSMVASHCCRELKNRTSHFLQVVNLLSS